MKLTDCSNQCLSLMLNEFHKTGKTLFFMSLFVDSIPEADRIMIINSLSLLVEDGLVKIDYADNEPYFINISLSAIRDAEDNTNLTKAYKALKEIRGWF